MKDLYIICVLFTLNSCTTIQIQKEEQLVVKAKEEIEVAVKQKPQFIADLRDIPQDVSYYTQNIHENSSFSQENYEKQYFKVWNIDNISISLTDAMWAYTKYKVGNTYGANLKLHKAEFFQNNLDNANYTDFKKVNKKALTLINTNIRAFPTSKPLFYDPKKAGEGFPFDYLQNSSIAPNKPLLVSHYSKDKKWVFVESSFTFGWVKSRDIVLIAEKYTEVWQKAEQVFIIKEGQPIYSASKDKEFLFNSRIGMMMPLVAEDEGSYTVLTPSKYKNKKSLYIKSKIDKSIASRGVLKFNTHNINTIIKEVSKTNYGWGGIFAQRDCSSTLRDFYAPFGLWLPRNSSKQGALGKVVNLEIVSDETKQKVLREEGVVFRTLVYKQGHIALYVGQYQNKAVIFQNVWGVKTQKDGVEGRFIIGRPIFSTLEVGKNLNTFDANASMLHKLKSISIL